MIHKAFLWGVSLSLLLLVTAAKTKPRSFPEVELSRFIGLAPGVAFSLEATPTPPDDLAPSPGATRTRRQAPPSTPAPSPQHNPGLIAGGILVVAIILGGVIRFARARKE